MKTYAKMGAFLALFLLASCGATNQTGLRTDDRANDSMTGGVYGDSSINNTVATVMRENPCRTSGMSQYGMPPYGGYQGNFGGNIQGQRQVVQVPVNQQLPSNQIYIGITSEGDVATLTATSNGATMNLHICERPGAIAGEGILEPFIYPRNSYQCNFGEIVVANAYIPSQFGQYYALSFRPITAGGMGGQSICSR